MGTAKMGFFDLIMGNNASGPSSPGASGAAMVSNPLAAIAGPSSSSVDDIDPQTGLRLGDIRNGQMQTMGQIGLLLAAAGQGGQSRAQRAATIAAIAPTMGQMNQHILNNAQARLLQTRASREQEQLSQRDAAVKALMEDPAVPSAVKNFAKADPDKALAYWTQLQTPQATEFEKNVDAMVKSGMSKQEAIDRLHPSQDKYGAVFNPMGDGVYTYNKGTGQGNFTPSPEAPPLPGQPGGASSPAAPTAPALANPASAFGPSLDPLRAGAASLFGGSISSSTAEGLQTRENVQMLRNRIIGTLASDLPGVKSKFQYQNLDAMLPPVGSWFTGPQVAMEKFKGIMPVLDQQKQEAAASYSNARTKKDKDEAYQSYMKIDAISKELGGLVNGLNANIGGKAYTPAEDAARSQIGGAGGNGAGAPTNILDIARKHIQ